MEENNPAFSKNVAEFGSDLVTGGVNPICDTTWGMSMGSGGGWTTLLLPSSIRESVSSVRSMGQSSSCLTLLLLLPNDGGPAATARWAVDDGTVDELRRTKWSREDEGPSARRPAPR